MGRLKQNFAAMFPTHCVLVASLLTICLAPLTFGAQEATRLFRPLVGAIRWDAWHGELSEVGKAVEKTLSPPKYHFRLPWFAKIHWHKPDLLFYQTFTAEECAQALKEALDFVVANPQACPANSVIIYAWNEFDEGGWLCPTLGANGKPDTSRIEAVGKILREWKPQTQK
jgi:hypothetical protein